MSPRLRVSQALGVAVAVALATGCGPARAPRTVSFRLAGGGPPSASVTIDDYRVGTFETVAARGVALPPGTHRVTVEAPGHFPVDRLVEAREGADPIRLDVTLVPIPE